MPVRAPKTSAKAKSVLGNHSSQKSALLFTFPNAHLATAMVFRISEIACITQSPALHKPKMYH